MKLPHLFLQVHLDQIFSIWVRLHQPPIVRIIPQEPLSIAITDSPEAMPENSVTCVEVRCWNDRGVMACEAFDEASLKVAQDWALRHRNTPPEDFKWYPEFSQ